MPLPSILLFVLGAAMVYLGVRMLRGARQALNRAQASLQWPRTSGRITASAVQFVDEGGDPPTGYFVPVVAYTYAVGDRTYAGTTIAFRDLRGGKATAEMIVANYPVGSDVAVSYDPSEPRNGVLEPGTAGVGKLFYWATAVILIGIGIAAVGVVIPILQ